MLYIKFKYIYIIVSNFFLQISQFHNCFHKPYINIYNVKPNRSPTTTFFFFCFQRTYARYETYFQKRHPLSKNDRWTYPKLRIFSFFFNLWIFCKKKKINKTEQKNRHTQQFSSDALEIWYFFFCHFRFFFKKSPSPPPFISKFIISFLFCRWDGSSCIPYT